MKELKLVISFILHWSVVIFGAFYSVFRIDKQYDWLYMACIGALILQWLLVKECTLSYFEKVTIDPTYIWGNDPSTHPSLTFYLNNSAAQSIQQFIPFFIYITILLNSLYITQDYGISPLVVIGISFVILYLLAKT